MRTSPRSRSSTARRSSPSMRTSAATAVSGGASRVANSERSLQQLRERCRSSGRMGSRMASIRVMSGPLPTSARPAGTSERRVITALFADIAGSTAMVERMDPEDWTEIVSEAFARMNRAVERYEGTVARLMGDGLLAFFGAPIAHEDDPQRAIRCGLDMVQAIDELGATLRAKGASELRVRVGISTGPVVVGVVGTDAAHEYTAMGDAVNVASRMQSAARPGAVLITVDTYRFVAPLVDATDLGALELKGKTAAVRAYEIKAVRPGASVRGLAGIRAAMIGRDAQLTRLRDAYAVARA